MYKLFDPFYFSKSKGARALKYLGKSPDSKTFAKKVILHNEFNSIGLKTFLQENKFRYTIVHALS